MGALLPLPAELPEAEVALTATRARARYQAFQRRGRVRGERVRRPVLCAVFRGTGAGGLDVVRELTGMTTAEARALPGFAGFCGPDRRRPGRSSAVGAILDVANDGTFAGARRAAELGRARPEVIAAKIDRLTGLVDRGRLSGERAGALIAKELDPVLAAAQADAAAFSMAGAGALGPRPVAAPGPSEAELSDAAAAKLREQCTPELCFLSGLTSEGKPASINFVRITTEEALALPGFVRFCTPDDIKAAREPLGRPGDWVVEKLLRARRAVEIAGATAVRRLRFIAGTGEPAPVPGEPAPAVEVKPETFTVVFCPSGENCGTILNPPTVAIVDDAGLAALEAAGATILKVYR